MAVRVGLIGAGVMGAFHAGLFRGGIANAVLHAVSDPDPDRARNAAGPARIEQDPHALIFSRDIDAVIVAAPDQHHHKFVLLALEAGKPVLCEKPLAPTVVECQDIVAAEKERSLVTTGFMRRFDPAYLDLRAALRQGEIGSPKIVYCIHRNAVAAPWMTTEMWFTNALVHELDICRWLLGAEFASASFPRLNANVDPLVVNLETTGGVLIVAEVFLEAKYGYHVHTEVVGETGVLAFSEPSTILMRKKAALRSEYAISWLPRFAEAYRLQDQAWIDSILSNKPATEAASARDGLAAVSYARQLLEIYAGNRFGRLMSAAAL